MTKLNKLNREFLVVFSLLALLIGGCSGGSSKEVNYHSGNDGITMDLVNQGSLDELYEDTPFAFSLSLENAGAYDLVDESQAIITLGFDPFYIQLTDVPKDGKTTVGKSNVVVKGIELTGKSKYTPSGGKSFLYFPYFKTKPIEGQRTKPDTQLFASVCYPYATTLSSLVCVDFDAYQDNSRTQVCHQEDQSFSSQGAPVAITQVEVENFPAGNFVKPVYTIHIANVGRGTIMTPADNLAELEKVCSIETIDRQDFNKVKVEGWLSNSIKLDCTPSIVRLDGDVGVARCSVSDEDVAKNLAGRQNFQAPLTVNLTYFYMTTLQQDIQIQRINPYGNYNGNEDETECKEFEVKSGGKCISKCEYCASVKSDDPLCNPSPLQYKVQWNNGFDCKCGKSTCDAAYPKGLCMPSSGYCAAATYCCTNACGSKEIRDSDQGGDGKCYPTCTDLCTALKVPCACGTQDEYSLAKIGNFCSQDGVVHAEKTECDKANDSFEEEAVMNITASERES